MAVIVHNDTPIEMVPDGVRTKRESDKFAIAFGEWRSNKHRKQVVRSQRRDHLLPDCEAIFWKVDEVTFLCEGRLG